MKKLRPCECHDKSNKPEWIAKYKVTKVFVESENRLVEVLELVALFLLETGSFGAENWKAISVDTIFCFVEIFSEKRRAKTQYLWLNRSSLILPRIQHKVVLLVLRTVFAVGFWLLSAILAIKFNKALGKNTLADSR